MPNKDGSMTPEEYRAFHAHQEAKVKLGSSLEDLIFPCPQCGQSVFINTGLVGQAVNSSCGHAFLLRSNAMRNPIPRARYESPSFHSDFVQVAGYVLVGLGIVLAAVGAVTGTSDVLQSGVGLIFLGPIGLAALLVLASLVQELRFALWLLTPTGRRHRRFESQIATARRVLLPAERLLRMEEERLAEEKRRRILAERAVRRNYLLRMSPRRFEAYVGELFQALGYHVRLTQYSRDEGVDAYLEKEGKRAIVQCKHYAEEKVGRPAVQQMFGVLKHEGVGEAFFVTSTSFSRQAIAFVQEKPIHLIDGDMLVKIAEGAFTEEFIRSGPTGRMAGPRGSGWRYFRY